jgi:hypothetical protein
VCFGSQVLAQALDAAVAKAPVREVGFVPIRPESLAATDPLLSHYADGDMVFQWHMDTFDLPAEAELLVTGDGVRHQAYRVNDRTWGVQYHLEIDRDEIESWLAAFAEEADLLPTWGKTNEQVCAEADRHLEQHVRKGECSAASSIASRDRGMSQSPDRCRRVPPPAGARLVWMVGGYVPRLRDAVRRAGGRPTSSSRRRSSAWQPRPVPRSAARRRRRRRA